MADQTVRIENLPDTSGKQQVAFKLMNQIADAEYYQSGSKSPDNPREYFLNLYSECRKRVY